MIRWPSSIRVRLALWHSILLGLPLVIFAVVCYIVFSRALIGGTDRFIAEALSAFSRELWAERRGDLTARQAMQATVHELQFRELHILILDPSGNVVAAAGPPDSTGKSMSHAPDHAELIALLAVHGDYSRIRTTSMTSSAGTFLLRAQPLDANGERFLLVGRYPLRDVEHTMADIRRTFSVAIPLLMLAAAASGYFLALRSLAPVASMAQRATAITADNLHERLPVSGGDELVRLARVVNDLLDRLESSFDQQRRFMADASHELRTPTAIVRTEADVTLSKANRTELEYRASVGIMQDASRRLTRIVDDLFLLARSDAGHLVVHRAPLYLEDIVDDAARSVRPLADRRRVTVSTGPMIESAMHGDADLLGRLLLNLLDNAIKHSPEHGTVTVEMARRDDWAIVTVVDEGLGIPTDARERVFERFYRVDSARTRQETSHSSGAGLGLAIARRIAEAHGGRLDLGESGPGRTVFQVTLPVDGINAPAAAHLRVTV